MQTEADVIHSAGSLPDPIILIPLLSGGKFSKPTEKLNHNYDISRQRLRVAPRQFQLDVEIVKNDFLFL